MSYAEATSSDVNIINTEAEQLPDLADASFGSIFDRLKDAKVVCLGEASHGTSEFYRARAKITVCLSPLSIFSFFIFCFSVQSPFLSFRLSLCF